MNFFGKKPTRKDIAHIIPRLIVVIVIAQTIPFKFAGAEESIWIFTQMGWEPWGRYLIASVETITVIFLISRFYIVGAILSLSVISGANFMHFTRLGFDVNGDGGYLFAMSIIVIVCSLIILIRWNMTRTQERISLGTVEAPDPLTEEVA